MIPCFFDQAFCFLTARVGLEFGLSSGRLVPKCLLRFTARAYRCRLPVRNQLKAWLIRHLVASNEGDGDLMAKAIATEGHNDDLALSGGYAGKGAPGRESSLSGRVCKPKSTKLYACTDQTSKNPAKKQAL